MVRLNVPAGAKRNEQVKTLAAPRLVQGPPATAFLLEHLDTKKGQIKRLTILVWG